MALSTAQAAVRQWILTNPTQSLWATGGAGTGKSFVLRACLDAFAQRRFRGVHVSAPTGIAAVNVSGMTLHKFLGIQPGFENMSTDAVLEWVKTFKENPLNRFKLLKLRTVHTLVIDEISMVHAKFFMNMDTLLREVREQPRKPFGGVRLFMVGDFLQLPPVQDNKKAAASPDEPLFVFETENWRALDPKIFDLEYSFRQENDNRFFNVLNEIRWGVVSDESKALLQSCVRSLPNDYTGPRMTLMPINVDVDRINKNHIAEIQQPLKVFTASDTGAVHLLRDIRALPRIELKVGAQVMLLKNISVKRPRPMPTGDDEEDAAAAASSVAILPNGAIGRVVGFDGDDADANGPSSGAPLVAFPAIGSIPAHTRTLGADKFDIVESMGEKPVATRIQVPLVASYAMSIHKAQGQTITCPVVTSTKRIFEPGQFYVLLSRAQTLDQLYLEDLDLTKIVAHPKAVAFMRTVSKSCPLNTPPAAAVAEDERPHKKARIEC